MAQQDKIIGYFLDESQEHLRVIEEGLITPQLLSQPAQLQEVFRAAHSLKGGAAMLELVTIKEISHNFEQAFQQIQTKSLAVDEPLQNLMLEGLEILRLTIQIVRHQQTPPPSLAEAAVFGKLQAYLSGHQSPETIAPTTKPAVFLPDPAIEEFSTYVSHKLRQFEDLANKMQSASMTRPNLADVCQKIGELGKNHGFQAWSQLLDNCQLAINHPLNSIEQLRVTIPQTIKQAQLLVISGNQQNITLTPELAELLPAVGPQPTAVDSSFDMSEHTLWSDETSPALTPAPEQRAQSMSPFSWEEPATSQGHELMPLFDEDATYDGTWVQEEDILTSDSSYDLDHSHLTTDDQQSDSLWEEDIFERPIPLLTLEDQNSGLTCNSVELQPTVQTPQFNFEEPSHSELFMEDEAKTDSPTSQLDTAAISLGNNEIDWSGLLANISDEAIVDYQEPVTPPVNKWSAHPGVHSIEPPSSFPLSESTNYALLDRAVSLEKNIERNQVLSAEISGLETADQSDELTSFDPAQPIMTDFTIPSDLTSPGGSPLNIEDQENKLFDDLAIFDLEKFDAARPVVTDYTAHRPSSLDTAEQIAPEEGELFDPEEDEAELSNDLAIFDVEQLDAAQPVDADPTAHPTTSPSLGSAEKVEQNELLDPKDVAAEQSDDLAVFNPKQVINGFMAPNSLAQQNSSILNPDNFHGLAVEETAATEENLILDVFEFDDNQFTFDFSSQPSTELEISSIFSVDPSPTQSPANLPTIDELMAKNLPAPVPQTHLQQELTQLQGEEWRELSVFDDLLADTQTIDADITDLNQIVINGNLDPEVELEDLEDLSDFLPASVSSSKLTPSTI